MSSALRIYLAIFPAMLLAGCATQSAYEAKLKVYIGKPIEMVMEKGNIPSREYQMPSGNKIYCFKSSSFMSLPVMNTPTQSISTIQGKNITTTTYGGNSYGGGIINLWCNTCFVTSKNNIITSFHLEGNDCVATS